MDEQNIPKPNNLKTIHTYASDMADMVRDEQQSVIKIALAEQKRRAKTLTADSYLGILSSTYGDRFCFWEVVVVLPRRLILVMLNVFLTQVRITKVSLRYLEVCLMCAACLAINRECVCTRFASPMSAFQGQH